MASKSKIKSQKSKVRNFSSYIVTFIFSFYLLSLMGCATIKETAKGLAGVSTKVLEDGRKDAIKKVFDFDMDTSYTKARDLLKARGCYLYAQDKKKRMLACWVSESDTTPVGVFFKEVDSKRTQIEVSSPSQYAKELIALRIIASLEKKEKLGTEKGKVDAEKEAGD